MKKFSINLSLRLLVLAGLATFQNTTAQSVINEIRYTRITDFKNNELQPFHRVKISADGERLVISANNGSSLKKIYTVKADGSELREIFDYATLRGGCPCTAPFVDISADGSTVIWTDGINEIFAANSDGSNRREFATIFPNPDPAFPDVEPDIRIPPRLTADGKVVYFANSSGNNEMAGLYMASTTPNAPPLKLFSYKDMSGRLFGKDGSEFNRNVAFTSWMAISDDGSRGVFASHNLDLDGRIIAFSGSSAKILYTKAPATAVRVGGTGTLSISQDGRKVGAIIGQKVWAFDFDGGNALELPHNLGQSFIIQLDSTGAFAMVHPLGTGNPVSSVSTDGLLRRDIVVLFGNPNIRLDFWVTSSSSWARNGGRIAFVAGEGAQVWVADINPKDNTSHPMISNVNFVPNFVPTDGSATSKFTAHVLSGATPVNFVNFDVLIDGVYTENVLFTRDVLNRQLLDNGTAGDITAGDGIYSHGNVGRVSSTAKPATLTIRVHAEAGRHITSLDVAPFFLAAPTSVHDNGNTVPPSSALIGNYPNPFSTAGIAPVRSGGNPSTMIKYDVAQPMEVTIEIFDLLGRKIRTLIKAQQPPGNYAIVWDGRNDNGQLAPSGIYIYQLRAGDFTQSMKMVFIR
jgi:hypothetical protein